MKEIELIDAFCQFLITKQWTFKRELRRHSYYSEGFIDLVILKNEKFIAIEAKLNGFQAVYRQATYNLVYCDLSYILYPRIPTEKNIKKCKDIGVGIIIPSDKTLTSFQILLKSISNIYLIERTHLIIKRNWIQNRIGRYINSNEIPLNYSSDKINELKPTYSWTKIKNKQIRKDIHNQYLDDFLPKQ